MVNLLNERLLNSYKQNRALSFKTVGNVFGYMHDKYQCTENTINLFHFASDWYIKFNFLIPFEGQCVCFGHNFLTRINDEITTVIFDITLKLFISELNAKDE